MQYPRTTCNTTNQNHALKGNKLCQFTPLKILLTAIMIAVCIPQEATAQRRKRRSTRPRIYTPRTLPKLPLISEKTVLRLATGTRVYDNEFDAEVSPSEATAIIEVTTDPNTKEDLVVILKMDGFIVANAYIQGYDRHTFYLVSGDYQVFFYQGLDWNSNKQMPKGRIGGFNYHESVTKGKKQTIDYAKLSYSLRLRRYGNFQPQTSSKAEAL